MSNLNLSKRLINVIKGVNLIPSMKSKAIDQMREKFKQDTIEDIMAHNAIDNLSADEMKDLLHIMYTLTGDEELNPNLLDDSSKDDDEGHKVLAIDDKSLYYMYDRKNEFTREYESEETHRVTMSLFRKSAEMERSLNKDLSEFNVFELEEFLKGLQASTVRSLQNYISKIERYTAFSIERGYTNNKINYAGVFDRLERIEELLDREAMENMILPRRELMSMATNADNAQDGVIIALLFDGVNLKNDFEELVNLKIADCNLITKEIKTASGRVISISNETARLIEYASDQSDTYVSINGESVRNYKIADGENVLRGLRGRKVVSTGVIGQRIARMADRYGYEYMNATNISYSGQVHYAGIFMDEGDSMEIAIDKVLEKFGIPINRSSQYYLRKRIESNL